MAAKRKNADTIDPKTEGTFEVRYKQGKEWIHSSTRYRYGLAQLDAEDLEADGKHVQIVKTSDKGAYDLDD